MTQFAQVIGGRGFRSQRHIWDECVRRDNRLSPFARLIAAELVKGFANAETGACFPTNDALAAMFDTTDRTVRRAISDLQKAGWLRCSKGVGRGNVTEYTFILQPGQKAVLYKSTPEMENKTGQNCPVLGGENDSQKRTKLSRKADKIVQPYYIAKPCKEPNAREGAQAASFEDRRGSALRLWADQINESHESSRDFIFAAQITGVQARQMLAEGLTTPAALRHCGVNF